MEKGHRLCGAYVIHEYSSSSLLEKRKDIKPT
jgi:hypothetical protein